MPAEFEDEVDTYWVALMVMSDEAHEDWEQFSMLTPSTIQSIVRAEFIWEKDTGGMQGVVLYDEDGAPLVHATNALLGYRGAGSELSRKILEALGVSRAMFDSANERVWNSSYVLIFSREAHQKKGPDEADFVVSWGNPRSYWEWWQVQPTRPLASA
jgi:hypothetical protein